MRAPLILLAAAAWTSEALAGHCPRGDAPGPVGELVIEQIQTHVEVVSAAAGLWTEVTLRNPSDGPARAAFTLATRLGDERPPPFVVQRAHIAGNDRAALDARDDARERFDTFVDALENGVDTADARDGGRAALLVSEADDGDVLVEVAAACSTRVLTVVVGGVLLGEPVDGGQRFVVPVVDGRDVLVATTRAGRLWVDGRRPGPGGRVVRAVAHAGSAEARPDDAFDGVQTLPFVIQVAAADEDDMLRADGLLLDVPPALAPKASSGDDVAHEVASIAGEHGLSLLGASLMVPRPMSAMPAAPRLVFVVDASVSAGADGVARALRLVHAVLDAAPPDAAWALITMQREPQLVVSPWQPRDRRYIPRVDVGNGSDVTAALALARRIGRDAEPGASRVIVLSDLQQKTGADDVLARALVTDVDAQTPVVHLVELPDDVGRAEALSAERVLPGEGHLATAVGVARGIHVVLSSTAQERDEDDAIALHLLRPTRLDDLRLFIDGREVGANQPDNSAGAGDGDGDGDGDNGVATRLIVRTFGEDAHARTSGGTRLPDFVVEGDGLRLAARLPRGARRAELRGLAWAEEVRIPVTALPSSVAAAAAGTVTNLDLRDAFLGARDVLAVIARQLGYVSAVTSLASVPTFRPARPEGGLGLSRRSSGCSCGCGGACVGMSRSCGWGTGKITKAREVLDQLARDIAALCRAEVDADIEVADLEILDVRARGPGRVCVAARLWRARLDVLSPGDDSFEARSTFGLATTAPTESDTDDDGRMPGG
jgi:hypothetical protein